MNILELLKSSGIEIDAEKGEAISQALGALIDESVNEATSGLKSKNDELLGKLKDQKTAAQIAQEKADELARKNMTVDELTESWKQRLQAREAELQDALDSMINNSCAEKSDALAMEVATKINPHYPKAVLPHVKASIKTDAIDGKFDSYFLDGEGKRAALSTDDFVKAFCENKDYAPLVGSSMGGAVTTGVTVIENSQSKHTYNDMSQAERAAYIKQKYSAE